MSSAERPAAARPSAARWSAATTAVVMVAGAEARRRRAALLGLALLVALVSGVVLGAASGTRRTATVLDRFLDATDASDGIVTVSDPGLASDPDRVTTVADDLAAVDGVEHVAPAMVIPIDIGTERDISLITGPDDRYLARNRPVVVEGRMPRDDAADEVALSEIAAAELGLGAGDRVTAASMSLASAETMFAGEAESFTLDGPAFDLEVVGVIRDLDSLSPSFWGLTPVGMVGVVSPAFVASAGDAAAFVAAFMLDTDGDGGAGAGSVDPAAVRAALGPGASGDETSTTWTRDDAAPLRDAIDTVAAGLTAFTAVALVAGLAAAVQALARHLATSDTNRVAVGMLGMTRRGTAAAMVLPVAGALVTGVAAGAVVAVASSPLFPISVGRRAELDGGVRVDLPVVLIGGTLLVAAMMAMAWASAWRRSGPAAPAAAHAPGRGPSRWRRLLPVPVAVAVTAVVRRRDRGIARSATAGVAAAATGMVAVAVFVASHETALRDPARYGWNWSSQPAVYTADPLPMVDELAVDPRIAAVGGLFCHQAEMEAEGEAHRMTVDTCGLMTVGGTIPTTVVDGRLPTAPGEIAFGRNTMRELGVGIDDAVVVVGPTGTPTRYVVVGRIAAPPIDAATPGDGAMLSREGFEAFTGAPIEESAYGGAGTKLLLLTYAPGVDAGALERDLASRHPLEFTGYTSAQPPAALSQIARVRPTLVALGVFLGVVGLTGVLHFLVLSARHRRKELAVLAALGFVRRQARASVTWQAVLVAGAGLSVGLPVGLLAGRAAWLATVDEVGMVDTPVVPVAAVLAIAAGAIAAAVVVAAVPGRIAARRRPAPPLRTE